MRSSSGVLRGINGAATSAVALCAAAVLAAAPAALAATVNGTPGNDTLVGTEQADTIAGGGGADDLSGLGGADHLFGQAGADVLDAGAGNDSLNGGAGPDVLKGGDGSDVTTLGPGDTAWAGDDRDYFRVGSAGDWLLHGGPGDDHVDVHVGGVHTVYGDAGNDVLEVGTLGSTATRVYGGPGDDQVLAAAQDWSAPLTPVALLSGGAGDDAFIGWAVTFDGGAGNDDIISSERTDDPAVSTIHCGDGVDTITIDRQPAGPLDHFDADCETVNVNTWSNSETGVTIDGTPYNDTVRTWVGPDTITTGPGNDRVDSGAGSDTVDLGAGDDYFSDYDDVSVDRVTCGPGDDRVVASSNDVVAASCETVERY